MSLHMHIVFLKCLLKHVAKRWEGDYEEHACFYVVHQAITCPIICRMKFILKDYILVVACYMVAGYLTPENFLQPWHF